MVPESIWAEALFIYKGRVRDDGFDFSDPIDIDKRSNFDAVSDDLPFMHGCNGWTSDFE